MPDEGLNTTLAHTKNPKRTQRTTFQDELIKAVAARAARQRSSEYSEDFDSKETGEDSIKTTLSDLHIPDDEENNSSEESFLEMKPHNDLIYKDPQRSIKNNEAMAPDGPEHSLINPSCESQNEDQEIPKETTYSAESISRFEADSDFPPSPLPRSMLEEHIQGEEKDPVREEKETTLYEEIEAHSTPSSLQNVRHLTAEEKPLPENFEPQETIEDINMKNKKSNDKLSSTLGRLMTPDLSKTSTPIKRYSSKAISSQSLRTSKVLGHEPSHQQTTEPVVADNRKATAYQEWLQKKNTYLHEKYRIEKMKNETLRIENEQNKAAKREKALASFEAWKAKKEKDAKIRAAQKRLEDKNKMKTEEDVSARKEAARQAFERWQEKKVEYLKEKNKREKEYEKEKIQKEQEIRVQRMKENIMALEKWHQDKRIAFQELKRAKQEDEQAPGEYENCLEKTDRQDALDGKEKKHRSLLKYEARPLWSPPRTLFSKETCSTSVVPSSLRNFGDCFSPGSEGKTSRKDFVNTALEKSKDSQVTTDDLGEENEKTHLIMNDDLTVEKPLLQSQSLLIPNHGIRFSEEIIEDRNMKNDKSRNIKVSNALGRLMTCVSSKKCMSIRRTSLKMTSSLYLGMMRVLGQNPSHKQNIELKTTENIRAAVSQGRGNRKDRIEQKHRKCRSFLKYEARPPWRPPSRNVFPKGI